MPWPIPPQNRGINESYTPAAEDVFRAALGHGQITSTSKLILIAGEPLRLMASHGYPLVQEVGESQRAPNGVYEVERG